MVRQQIKRLEDPSFQCIGMIHEELLRILGQLEGKKVFKRFPALKEKLHIAVSNFLQACLIPTNKLVGDILKSESSYINTAHPDFLSGHRAMAIVTEKITLAKVQTMERQLQTAQKLQQAVQGPATASQASGKPGAPAPAPIPEVQITPQMAQAALEASQYAQSEANTGFFGSFFNGTKKHQPQPILEAVCILVVVTPFFSSLNNSFFFFFFFFFCVLLASHDSQGHRKPLRPRENGNGGHQ